MEPAVLILIVVGFVALIGTIAYLQWQAEKKRQSELAAFAAANGFAFDPGHDSSHDDRFAQFEIFRRGHSRIARNTMTGRTRLFDRDCRIVCGDFRYKVTSSNGKTTQTTTYNFSYLIVHPPWDTPPLLIRPEGFFDKVAGAFGFDDIDFESDEFSRKFYVKSPDKRFAYDVLHPRMMEFLLGEQPPMIDIEDRALCLGGGKKRWSPAEFDRKLEFVRGFCELWPRHLVRDLDHH
ncbi:MAG: hypothetical protein KDE27_29375 [Planctomycetes bacterium]|nr:hypothetical protein [Planctomycetota bacterium]